MPKIRTGTAGLDGKAIDNRFGSLDSVLRNGLKRFEPRFSEKTSSIEDANCVESA